MAKVLDRLYATDYYAWTQEQAAALRRLAASRADLPLDLDHLAEEVEDLGKSERRAVRSQMRRLLEHLLRLQYATATEPRAGWRRSIVDARIELADDLTPTLRREVEADLANLYDAAREQAAEALAGCGEEVVLPEQCPWGLDEVLRRGWLAEEVRARNLGPSPAS